MQKYYIYLLCSFLYSGIFAQNVDSIYTKAHLNNYLNSNLSTGIYLFESERKVFQKRMFQNSYKQEFDTIEFTEKKMFLFSKRKKAILVRNKTVSEIYLENIQLNPFEREDTLRRYKVRCGVNKYFWKINPKPILLSCDIQNIEIVNKVDNIYSLIIKVKNNATNNFTKYIIENNKSIFGVIVNDNIIMKIDIKNIKFDNNNNLKSIELEFKDTYKEDIEYFKSELIK